MARLHNYAAVCAAHPSHRAARHVHARLVTFSKPFAGGCVHCVCKQWSSPVGNFQSSKTCFPQTGHERIQKMKKNLHRIALVFVICTLLNAAALAGGKSKRVIFDTDVMVGNTLVKKGSYKVTFDEQTGTLTIINGRDVIAKTSARLEEFKNKSEQATVYRTWKNEKADAVLSRVNLGSQYAVIGGDNNAATSSAPAATGQQ